MLLEPGGVRAALAAPDYDRDRGKAFRPKVFGKILVTVNNNNAIKF
ncbi:hypothetical protein [Lusitaniella coriacea]